MTTTREILDNDPFGKGLMENMFRDQHGEKPTLRSKGAPYWFLAEWREGRTMNESRLAAVPGLDGHPVVWHDKNVAKKEFAARYGNKPYLLMQAHEGRDTCFVEQVGSKMARPMTLVNVPAVVESTIHEVRTRTDGERKETQGEWPKLSAVGRANMGKKDGKNIWIINGERPGTIVYWKRSSGGNAISDYLDGKKKWWGCNNQEAEIVTKEALSIHWADVREGAEVIREETKEGLKYFADGVPVFWHANEHLATIHLDKLSGHENNQRKATVPMKIQSESIADLAQRQAMKDAIQAAITKVDKCPVSKKDLDESNTVVVEIPGKGQTVVHAEVWDRGKDKILSEYPNAKVHDGRLVQEAREFDPFTSKNPKNKFDPFVAGYIAAALFTMDDDEIKTLGIKHDDLTVDHLAPEAIQKMTKAAKDFWKKYEDTIKEAGLDPYRAGTLLYYSHSGAGVTWLDDDDNEALRKLDDAPEARFYAEPYNLYVGDDGKVYRESAEEDIVGKTVNVLKQNTMGVRRDKNQRDRVYLYPGKYRVESSLKHNGQDSYLLRHTGDNEPYIVAKSEMDTTTILNELKDHESNLKAVEEGSAEYFAKNKIKDYTPGTKVRVADLSGIDSGKTGVIVKADEVPTDVRHLVSKGWLPVKLDDGVMTAMPKNRLLKPMNEEKALIQRLLEEGGARCIVTNEALKPETTVVVTVPGKGSFLMHAEAFDKKRDSLNENVQVLDGRVVFEASHKAKDEDQADDNFEKWVDTHDPQKNHLNDNAAYNGWMYETYGKEAEYIETLAQDEPNRIWTLVEGDDGMWVVSGHHLVNRIGHFVTKKPWKKSSEYQIETTDGHMDESVTSAGISGSSNLGKRLHQWHKSSDDSICRVGSKFMAGKKASKEECLSASIALQETNHPETQALAMELRKLCGVTEKTEEGLARLTRAIAEATVAHGQLKAAESKRKLLEARVERTARQMGGGVRTYGVTARIVGENIVAESSSDTGNTLFPFVPFDDNAFTNSVNELAKASMASTEAARIHEDLRLRMDGIARSLALGTGTHEALHGLVETSPEGEVRLANVKSESFAVDEDNPVHSWMLVKPFREHVEGMLRAIGNQFEKASAETKKITDEAGGRLDFGGFSITSEDGGVALYGNSNGVRPFLENIANGTIGVQEPVRQWAKSILLRQAVKVTAENLRAIEDRSREIVLASLPEEAAASIVFEGREQGILYKHGTCSAFVDHHSVERVFGCQPMSESETNAILAWSRLHDIDKPSSMEEQAIYEEQLKACDDLVEKIREERGYFCFRNDDGVVIEMLSDEDGIRGMQARKPTHVVSGGSVEAIEEAKETNEAFSKDEDVPVDMSAAQLTLELRSKIKDMDSGLVEKASAAASAIGQVAEATIKAWTEKLGGTYQESGDADLFEGATSITDNITRSWIMLNQAKENHQANKDVFDMPYGQKLGSMLDEALAGFASTIKSFYTPQPWGEANKLDEKLVVEAAMDLEASIGNFANLVESTAILEPGSLKMQAASMARVMDKANKGVGPKAPMKPEAQKQALKAAHGIVSMAHALVRSLGKNSEEARLALSRMEKDPLFVNWKSQIGKKMNTTGSTFIPSQEVKTIRNGLNAASRELGRISGEGIDEMREAITAARKVVNKIGADLSIKNLGNVDGQETHFEAKEAPKTQVTLETLPEDEQVVVQEYLTLQAKIKALKDDIEALEGTQEPSKKAVIAILERINANLEDAKGSVISLRVQPGKILYNKVIEQALLRVNEATREILNKLMESTRGSAVKYPVVSVKKDVQTEGLLDGLVSMGKKAWEALAKALGKHNKELSRAVGELKVAAKNARMGIVTEIATTTESNNEPRYPNVVVPLIGASGNAMAIIASTMKAMKKAGVPKEEIEKYSIEARSGDYDNVLSTTLSWVNVENTSNDGGENLSE